MTKTRRFLAVILTLLMLTSPISPLAAEPGGEGEAGEVLPDGLYSIPIDFFNGYGNGSWFTRSPFSNTPIAFNQRALLTVDDGAYSLTLQFYAYSILEMLQIVDPDKVGALIAGEIKFAVNGDGTEPAAPKGLGQTPMADIDRNGNYMDVEQAGFLEAIESKLLYVRSEARELYLPSASVRIEQGDEDLEITYLTLAVNNLTDPILLKAVTYETVEKTIATTKDMIGFMEPGKIWRVPDDIAAGAWEFEWGDFFGSPTSVNKLSKTTYMSLLLENTRQASSLSFADGAVQAVFDLGRINHFEDFVDPADTYGIEIYTVNTPVGRERAVRSTYLNGIYNTRYDTIYDYADETDKAAGVFTLTLPAASARDWVFGAPTGKCYGRIYPVPVRSETVPLTLTDGEVTLDTDTAAAPAESVFTAPAHPSWSEELRYIQELTYKSYTSLAVAGHYRVYEPRLTAAGAATEPAHGTLRFDLPDDWDLSRLYVVRIKSSIGEIEWTVYDETAKIVEVALGAQRLDSLHCGLIFVEKAQPLVLSELGLENGKVYRAKAVIYHATMNYASMSNVAIADNTVYITAEDGGGYKLYTELRSAVEDGSSLAGYMRNLQSYQADSNSELRPSEHLAYYAEDGVLQFDWLSQEYDIAYLRRAVVDLADPGPGGYYWVKFSVPAMDGLLGGLGRGDRNARMAIIAVEEAADNPYDDYDKTVILLPLHKADQLLATETLNEAGEAILNEAAAAALAVYNSDPADSAVVKAARDALTLAIEQAATMLREEDSDWPEIYGPGSYEGAGSGHNGAITVSVEVDAKRILSITIGANVETPGYLSTVASVVPERVLAAQSAGGVNLDGVDTVSGATYSSNGIKQAVAAALAEARAALVIDEPDPGADMEALADAIAVAAAIADTGYIADSYEALLTAVAAAETALAGGGLSPEQIETQIAALEAAEAALIEETALQARPAEGEPVEGTYSLAGRTTLKQFASNNDSMGNLAIDHSQSYLEIDENGARVHLFFNPLRVPLGGSEFEGYLL
ncbi:MAG: FMN-binding protein, partial [Gracilibacteraceae bacterium]|nr:FMN-binding protein [Gracilibacteraceae bacterium]